MQTGGYDAPVSGTLAGSNNNFSINIPSLGLGNALGGSGLSLNFDMGSSPSAIASQAYDFLNQSFATDQGFVNQSISGTQTFLAHQVSPILAVDAAQINQNAKYIPQLYGNIFKVGNSAITAIQQNTAAGVAAQQAEAVASINASAQASGGGGGCYITTAVCTSLNLGDDCDILQTLRKFRDEHMGGKPALREYYETAPGIVTRINARSDARACYRQLLRRFILPSCAMIRAGFNDAAYRFYRAGCYYARDYANGVR